MKAKRCVCGGYIHPRNSLDIESSVVQHNMSLTHRVWRYGREAPTARYVIRDVSGCLPCASAPPGRFS